MGDACCLMQFDSFSATGSMLLSSFSMGFGLDYCFVGVVVLRNFLSSLRSAHAGNYSEGFGHEDHKKKWLSGGTTIEVLFVLSADLFAPLIYC